MLLSQAEPAYKVIDGFMEGGVDGYPSLNDLQREAAELRESQELFELYVSDYVSLARCRVSPFMLAHLTLSVSDAGV